ncbi:MAG: hypothetical protein Q9218_001720 [Villophora microphyllina]
MLSHQLSTALLALLSSASVLAAPLESASNPGLLLSRDAVALKPSNCSDFKEPVAPSCWTSLKVADFLNSWNQTTRQCGEKDPNGVGCCVEEEPWTTCFIRLSTGYAGDSCTSLGGTYCRNVPKELDPDLAPAVRAPTRYVINAIYAVHDLFYQYDLVLKAVSDSTIVEVLDVFSKGAPLSRINSLRNELPTALTLGLSIASQTTTSNDTIAREISNLWTSALQAAPRVPHAIWPNNTDNSQTVSITDINVSIGNEGTYLEQGLDLLMYDIATFQAFTSDGRFANSTLNNIIPRIQAANVADGLNTFVTSKLMQSSNVYATPIPDPVDRTTFEANNQCLLNADSWCVAIDKKSVFYWSRATHRQYQLRDNGPTPISLTDMMAKIAAPDGWANAELLFDGNYNCTAKGNAGGAIAFVGQNGAVDAGCEHPPSAFPISPALSVSQEVERTSRHL